METSGNAVHHEPWNKGKTVGQKDPFGTAVSVCNGSL